MTKLLANKKFKFALGIILAFLLVVTLIPAIHTAYGEGEEQLMQPLQWLTLRELQAFQKIQRAPMKALTMKAMLLLLMKMESLKMLRR